jgi:uncharacterized protein YacL (UPF0231 family)
MSDNESPITEAEVKRAVATADLQEIKQTIQEQKQQQQQETITIPVETYRNLIQANALSLQNTINTLDYFDKIVSSLVNVQSFVMNLKDIMKKSQFGTGENQNQSQNQNKA